MMMRFLLPLWLAAALWGQYTPPSGGGGGGSPSGAAGGDLSGTYPNPGVQKVNGGSVPASAKVLGSNSSSQPVAAVASDLVGLFSTCSGTQYLGADGACHNGGATGSAGGDLSGSYPNPTVGKVNGGSVPASAKVLGTNSSSQPVAAVAADLVGLFSTCSGTQYLGADGACHSVSGSPTGSAGGDLSGTYPNPTVGKVNGGSVPASAPVLGTNSSNQPVAASGHGVVTPLECPDTSNSASALTCATSPTFTPAAGDAILLTVGSAANSGSLTLNVNSTSAVTVKKQGGAANLAANDFQPGHRVLLIYDGTYWQTPGLGNAVVTQDGSGNVTVSGTLTTGNGSGQAGAVEFGQGTAPSLGTNSIKEFAPSSVGTSYGLVKPGSAPTADQIKVVTSVSASVGTEAYKTLPPCVDSGGNHLNWDPSTHNLSCGTSSSGGGGGSTISTGAYASLPSCTTSGTMYLFTDSIYNYAYCNGTAWSYFVRGMSVTPPGSTSWTAVNGSTVTDTTTYGYTNRLLSGSGSGYAYDYAAVAGTFTRTFMFQVPQEKANGTSVAAVIVSDGTKCMLGYAYNTSGGASQGLATYTDTNCSASGSNPAGADYTVEGNAIGNAPFCIRVVVDSTNVNYSFSNNCEVFRAGYSQAKSFFGSSIVRVGWAMNASVNHSLDLLSFQ